MDLLGSYWDRVLAATTHYTDIRSFYAVVNDSSVNEERL